MKKILILINILICYTSYSQEVSYVTSSPEGLSLNKSDIYMLYFGNDDIIEISGTYEIIIKDSIPFLRINNNNEISEFIYLSSDNFAFFSNHDYNSSILLRSNSVSTRPFAYIETWGFTPLNSITASSTYAETGSDYSVSNTQVTKLSPWVEGSEGPGIGESIRISYEQGEHLGGVKYLLFSNGFVSPKDPSLYKKNNRIKQIKVISIDKNFEIIIDIKDTPNIQELYLPESTNEIEIIIMDIYKGTTWDDTCINLLVGIKEDPKLEESIKNQN